MNVNRVLCSGIFVIFPLVLSLWALGDLAEDSLTKIQVTYLYSGGGELRGKISDCCIQLYVEGTLGILAKIKSRIFCLGETEGRRGRQNQDCFQIRKNARFCSMRKVRIIKNWKTILG